jgi:hypothetical protein
MGLHHQLLACERPAYLTAGSWSHGSRMALHVDSMPVATEYEAKAVDTRRLGPDPLDRQAVERLDHDSAPGAWRAGVAYSRPESRIAVLEDGEQNRTLSLGVHDVLWRTWPTSGPCSRGLRGHRT